MNTKLYSVAAHPVEGFCLDNAFYDRVIDSVETKLGTDIPRDADNMEIIGSLIAASVAEFMTTFEVKKQ